MSRAIDADALEKEGWSLHRTIRVDMNTEEYQTKPLKQVPTIEPQQRWIPCSDEPDTDRNVFIARGRHDFMSVCIGHYDHDAKMWYEDKNWFAKCLYDELYWCEIPPLPELYREEGEE